MHICPQEIMAIGAGITALKFAWPWLKAKCGIGCKHEEDVHDCGTCEVDFECESNSEETSP